jgi:hypothetical protein
VVIQSRIRKLEPSSIGFAFVLGPDIREPNHRSKMNGEICLFAVWPQCGTKGRPLRHRYNAEMYPEPLSYFQRMKLGCRVPVA